MTEDERRAAEQDCARLIAVYANHNDAGRWDAVAALFTDDGRLARPSAPDQWIEGRGAILAAFLARPARRTRHLCSNVVIDVLGRDEATGECSVALFTANDRIRVGSFQDRFRRVGGIWRFAERRGAMTFD